MARCFTFFCVLACVSLVGCAGDGTVKTVSVSGTVELDGKPLEDGAVALFGEVGTTPNTLTVTHGKFEGPATPGNKTVQIRAFKLGEATKMGDTIIEAPKVNFLPSKYNTESKIKAEVGASGEIAPSKFEVKSN